MPIIKKKGEDYLRSKVLQILNLIQANQLFVHSKILEIKYINPKSSKIKTTSLPEILTICLLNAIVSNSAMLLIGGHGGGKTKISKVLGRMFTGLSLHEIENSIVRGHSY